MAQSTEMTSEVRRVVACNTVTQEKDWIVVKGAHTPHPLILDTGLSDRAWQRTVEAIARHLNHPDPASAAARFMLNLTRERTHAG